MLDFPTPKISTLPFRLLTDTSEVRSVTTSRAVPMKPLTCKGSSPRTNKLSHASEASVAS